MLGWNQYFATIDEDIASIVVNLDAGTPEERDELPFLCRLTLTLLQPDEHGLSQPLEDPRLIELEDQLQACALNTLGGLYVGRHTSSGLMCFAFYLPTDSEPSVAFDPLMATFPEYSFSLEEEDDEEWNYFEEFLYPDRENLQHILNARVIEELREQGDDLSGKRPVEHWLYFSSLDGMLDCKEKLLPMGYKVCNEAYEEEEDKDMPYMLHISREENLLEEESFGEMVIYLLRLVDQFDGEYDGWETEVLE